MKKIGFLPLLTVTPLLMGFNAVPPYQHPDAYEDFEVSNFALGTKEEDEYPYSLELENKGEGYIQLSDFTFHKKNDDSSYYYIADSCSDLVITSLYLAPKQKTPINGRVDFEATSEDLAFISRAFQTYSYREAEGIEFASSGTTQLDSKTYYDYYFKIANLTVDQDYYYTYLIEFTYEDITYAVECYSETFYINFLKEIDPSKDVTFGRVVTIQGRYKRKDRLDSIWLTIWIIVAAIIVLGGIVGAIIVPFVLAYRH